MAASRSNEPRIRSKGCGMPTKPPCSLAAAIVSIADNPGGIGLSRNRQIRSPSRVLTSSPTMTVSSGAASACASCATSIRSWSVIARCVNPRSTAALTISLGDASESKLPFECVCRSTNARITCERDTARLRAAGGVAADEIGGHRQAQRRRCPTARRWRRQDPRNPSNLLDERLLEELEVLERESRPERHAIERVLRNMALHPRDLCQQL